MAVAAIDRDVQYAVLPARTVKVLARMVQKSLDTAGYVRISRKTKKRPDPNSCKTT